MLANFREISGTKNQKHVEAILAELNTMVRRESPKIAHITERITALTGHADELVVSVKPLVANLDRRGHQRQHHRRCRSRAANQGPG